MTPHPALIPEKACRLYRCCLEDIIEETVRLRGMEIALAYPPADARSFFQGLAHAGIRLVAQEGRGLGERQLG